MVLNIFSYWAEHKGRIPISKVCRRSQARDLPPRTQVVPTHLRTTASIPSPQGQPSYWQDLLAVQAVAVQKEGVDCVARARRLHPNFTGGFTPFRPLNGLQEISVATREESGVICFPSRRGLTPQVPKRVLGRPD